MDQWLIGESGSRLEDEVRELLSMPLGSRERSANVWDVWNWSVVIGPTLSPPPTLASPRLSPSSYQTTE